MRGIVHSLGMAGLFALCAAGSALAQHPQKREGFWIGFGFGYGSADVKSDTIPAAASRESGPTGFIKLGGALSKKVLLGGEVNAWTKSESGATFTLGNVSAAAYFYPAPETGFFLKGGVGFADYEGRAGHVFHAAGDYEIDFAGLDGAGGGGDGVHAGAAEAIYRGTGNFFGQSCE